MIQTFHQTRNHIGAIEINQSLQVFTKSLGEYFR